MQNSFAVQTPGAAAPLAATQAISTRKKTRNMLTVSAVHTIPVGHQTNLGVLKPTTRSVAEQY